MSILPKIKIGRKSDRNFFDYSHDVNTTSDFGFCQPTILQNIVADSKITLNSRSFIRLAPLPVPTFGRINVKQRTAFVPYRDIFLGYDNFQSGKAISSGVRTYVPTQANTITNSRLFNFVANLSYLASKNNQNPMNNLFFKIGVFANLQSSWFPRDEQYYDLFNLYDIDVEGDFDEYALANRLLIAQYLLSDPSGGNSPLNQLFLDNFGHKLNYLGSNYSTYNTGVPYFPLFADLQFYRDHRERISRVPSEIFNVFGGSDFAFLDNVQSYEVPFFSERITLQNADFIFNIKKNESFTVNQYMGDDNELRPVTYSKQDFIFCIKLTRLGRRLFKIFNCDRINFGIKKVPVDLLSLLAYYKVWFEQYNPGRNVVWEETNAFKLIHTFYDFGKDLNDCYDFDSISVDNFAFSTREIRRRFGDFLNDLANCTYSLPVDNITVATETPLLEIADNKASLNSIGVHANNQDVNDVVYPGVSDTTIYGFDRGNRLELAGGLGLKLLDRIYHLVNKNSVLGSKIDEYLKAHNLGSPLPESLVLGDNDFTINVEEQFSTAETAEGYLGEYAGKARKFDEGDFMKFETPNSGIVVQYFCIVPFGGYVQSGRVGMVNRYDFYNAFYDSLGKEPLTEYEVCSRFYYLNNLQENSVFGFVPQYFNKKVVNNLANGGFAFRSQNSQFLPYSLDRLFTVPDLVLRKTIGVASSGGSYDVLFPEVQNKIDLLADEYLRFIGRNEGFGNYNRIFYDTSGLTDNFIVQMVHEFHVYSPMKPVSESFDTFDRDVDNGYVEVKHS